jgi:hypothetical protein
LLHGEQPAADHLRVRRIAAPEADVDAVADQVAETILQQQVELDLG